LRAQSPPYPILGTHLPHMGYINHVLLSRTGKSMASRFVIPTSPPLAAVINPSNQSW
jgi:hypothetical protein